MVSYLKENYSEELSMYLGIHHCEILVTDINKALSFYKDILGLEELHNPSSFLGSKWLKIGNQQLHLTYHAEEDGSEHRHFAIAVKNLSEARNALVKQGVSIKAAIPIPGVDRFFIFDPFGNRIEFVQTYSKQI